MKRFAVGTGLAGISLVLVSFMGSPLQAVTLPVPLPSPIQTIIQEVPVPGPVQTVIQQVPGPVRTVFVPSPGPTKTVFVDRPVPGPTRTIIIRESQGTSPIGQPPSPRATVSSVTPTPQPSLTPEVTVSPFPVPGKDVERRVEVSVPQAIGISLGLVALGIALSLLALYLVYVLGYKERARVEEKKLADLTDELFGR